MELVEEHVIAFSGSRGWPWTYQWMIDRAIQVEKFHAARKKKRLVLVHGGATGVDSMVASLAIPYGAQTRPYPVSREDWEREGKKAGVLRNERMIRETRPLKLYAFRVNESKGTTHCVSFAKSLGILVIETNLWNYSPETDDGF